jgi:hypothetical protein
MKEDTTVTKTKRKKPAGMSWEDWWWELQCEFEAGDEDAAPPGPGRSILDFDLGLTPEEAEDTESWT